MTDVLEQTPPEPARAEGPRPGTPDGESPRLDRQARGPSELGLDRGLDHVRDRRRGRSSSRSPSCTPTCCSRTPRRPAATWAPTSGARPTSATTCSRTGRLIGLDARLVRRLPAVPVLHGRSRRWPIVLLNVLLPYGIALQAGRRSPACSRCPIAVWAFGRLSGLRFPVPALLGDRRDVVPLRRELHDLRRQHRLDPGGRVLLLDRLSLAARLLRRAGPRAAHRASTGRSAAVLFALSRALPPDRRRSSRSSAHRRAGSLLYARPAPLQAGSRRGASGRRCSRRSGSCRSSCAAHYLNDMGWEQRTDYVNMLFPAHAWQLGRSTASPLGALGSIAVARAAAPRRRAASVVLTLISAVVGHRRSCRRAASGTPGCCPSITSAVYLLAALGVAGSGSALCLDCAARIDPRAERLVRARHRSRRGRLWHRGRGMSLRVLAAAAARRQTSSGSVGAYSWLGLTARTTSFVNDWAKWNYTGYEGKPAYPRVLRHHADDGRARPDRRLRPGHVGVRATQHDRYGTPMALMLLPFWTDGCIGSMEGLYFESSATTPYHFLNQDELSTARHAGARPALRPAGRREGHAAHAAPRRQVLHGVLARGSQGSAPAEGPGWIRDLRQWVIFQVADSDIVTPLTNQPVVVKGADKDAKSWSRTECSRPRSEARAEVGRDAHRSRSRSRSVASMDRTCSATRGANPIWSRMSRWRSMPGAISISVTPASSSANTARSVTYRISWPRSPSKCPRERDLTDSRYELVERAIPSRAHPAVDLQLQALGP